MKTVVKQVGHFERRKGDMDSMICVYSQVACRDSNTFYRDDDIESPTYGKWFSGNPIDKNSIVLEDNNRFVVLRN